ncbi:MAG: immune inhibitor A [Bacteroidales bacterium]
MGGGDDGFWCPINRIIPIAQENMIQNLLAAAFAGSYAHIEDLSPSIIGENEGNIAYDVTRLGLKDGATFTVTLEPLSDVILSTGDPKVYSSMEILESITDSISYTLQPFVPSGTVFQFLMTLDNGEYVLSDTLTKIFGEPIVIYEDDCNTLTNWSSPQWAVTTSSYHSATGSITDSPFGDYGDDQNNIVTLNENIDLTNAGFAMLNFWAKWEIEQGWDYVQLMISTNNGGSWTPLEGKYTVTGNGNQAQGEPLYDGFQNQWVREEIDLTDYIGSSVKFRFRLKSDGYVTEDGYYFDDFTISVVEFGTTGEVEDFAMESNILISNPIPNPAKSNVKFNVSVPEVSGGFNFTVYSTSGQVIYSETLSADQSKLQINTDSWTPGIYYYKVEGSISQTQAKKLIVIK